MSATPELARTMAQSTYGLKQVKDVLELCEIAGAPVERFVGFVQAGTPPELVRQQLVEDQKTAGWSEAFDRVHAETPAASPASLAGWDVAFAKAGADAS